MKQRECKQCGMTYTPTTRGLFCSENCRIVSRKAFAHAATSKYNRTEKCKAYLARYRKTEKHKAYMAEYAKTEQRKASVAKYQKTEKGKAVQAASTAKHIKTDKYKTTCAERRKTDKHKANEIRYRKTKKGKARAARANAQRWARKAGVIREPIDPIAVFNDANWRCGVCGGHTPKTLRGSYDPRAPELDHIVPLAAGGSHTLDNVQCCCRACNGSKGARTYQADMFMGATAT